MQDLALPKNLLITNAVLPQRVSGSSDVNGTVIDLFTSRGATEGVLKVTVGAATGTPTTAQVTVRVQHSDASGSGFVDVTDTDIVSTVGLVKLENTSGQIELAIDGLKRYIRAVVLPAFSGGSSPTLSVSAELALGHLRFV